MNILVSTSTLYYLQILILYCTYITIPPLWIDMRMPNPQTRPECYFHFRPLHRPRLVPIGRSCDAGHLHANLVAEKRSESCRLKPWKAAELPLHFATISPISGDAITWVLLPTILYVFSDQSQPRGEPICRWSVIEGFTALRARSGTITTCERSPPPPLDSARPEVSNLSFPSPSVEIRSPLVGMGILVMFTWMHLKLT